MIKFRPKIGPTFGRRPKLAEKQRGGGQNGGEKSQKWVWRGRRGGCGCRGVYVVTVENVEEFSAQKNRLGGR